MHLYLIRHGESESNLPEWEDAAVADVGLTERGHRQAEAAAVWIRDNILPPDVVYCSTLRRTRQTGAYLEQTLQMPLNFDDRVREIGNNTADNRPISPDEQISYAEYWASAKPFSSSLTAINGESMMHFRTRIGSFVHDILDKHHGQVVLVVCHGFVIDTFMDIAYNVGSYRHTEVWTSNTGITHLQYIEHPGRERWRLHYQNRIEHLQGIGGLGLSVNGALQQAQSE